MEREKTLRDSGRDMGTKIKLAGSMNPGPNIQDGSGQWIGARVCADTTEPGIGDGYAVPVFSDPMKCGEILVPGWLATRLVLELYDAYDLSGVAYDNVRETDLSADPRHRHTRLNEHAACTGGEQCIELGPNRGLQAALRIYSLSRVVSGDALAPSLGDLSAE